MANQRVEAYFATGRLKPTLRSRAIRAGGFTYLAGLANYVLQIGATVLLARLLTPEDFGLISMVTSLTGILLMLRDIGLSDAVIQAQSLDQRQMSTLFWINALFNSGLSLVVIFLAPLVARFYGEPRVLSVTIVLSLTFVFYGLSDLHMALLKRSMHFWSVGTGQIVATLLSNSAAVLLAWRGYGYWALVARNVVLAVSVVAVAWIACRWRPGLPARRVGIGSFIAFGANSLGYLIMNYFTRNLDKTLVGRKYGAMQLGYYDKAFGLFTIPVSQLTTSLHHVAVSTLGKLRGEPEEYRRYYLSALAAIAFLGMPVCAFLSAMSRDIIVVLLGPKWIAAAPLFFLFTLSGGVHIVYSTHEWLHVSLGRADRWFRWGIIALTVTVTGYAAALFISTKAVAAAYALSIFVLVGPCLEYAGRPIGLHFRDVVACVWKYFVAAALAGVLSRVLLDRLAAQESPGLRVFIAFFVFALVYLSSVVALFRSTQPVTRFVSLIRVFLGKDAAQEARGAEDC